METVVASRELLEQKGFALSNTYGASMRPLIWGGSHCVVVVPLEGEPATGDILMFRHTTGEREKSIVHRLVGTKQIDGQQHYITRGDNKLTTETVRRDEIIGRVAEVHRLTGYRPWHIIPSKKFTVNDRVYRCYVRFWTAIWTARRLYYRFRGILTRLSRRRDES